MSDNQQGKIKNSARSESLVEWIVSPLSAVADVHFSSVNKVSQPGEIPIRLCNYTDVYNNEYITAEMNFMRATATKPEIDGFRLEVGDVIITKDSETPNDIGIPAVMDSSAPDLICGYHLALLRPNQDLVDPTFLAKQLAHHRIAKYFGQQANGTTRYGLSTAAIANAPLHFPRIEDQQRASALMRLVDRQIAHTEAVISKLKQIRAGLLKDLLSFGLDENGELREPVARPEQFKDSTLGRIPKEWATETIGALFDLGRGRVISQLDLAKCPGLYPVYSSQSAKDGVFGYLGTYDFEGDYITWTTDGANAGTVFYRTDRFNCTNVCGTLKSRGRVCESFGALAFARESKKHVSYVGNPKLMNNTVSHIRISFPNSLDEQLAIIELLNNMDTIINNENSEYNKQCCMRLGIQDDLLTGRVRVPACITERIGT